MIEKVNSPANIQAMLQTLKQYETEAKSGLNPGTVGKSEVPQPSFLDSVKSAVGSVNDAAQAAGIRKTAYEKGEDIPLTDVVLSMQRSSVAFEATLQIRNKMLRAYEEVLRMPV
ncbi:flagellar hook-basal body complex protein FliE [Betaproteobacteria bacterium]|nr:flagellar hook-basal body complex protein FliE [Betaproteobacteria bacterium]